MNSKPIKRLDPKVYNLASNLYNLRNQVTEDQFIDTAAAVIPNDCIMAIYPAVTQEAFATTMDNYRIYVSKYNFKCEAENREIAKYNHSVEAKLAEEPLTDQQKKIIAFFQAQHGNKYTRDYNIEVEKYNQEYGMILKKNKIQTVKYSTELVFSNFLYLYNTQLMVRNTRFISCRFVTPTPLPEFNIDSQKVTRMTRNGVASLDLCKKSIRSHRQRLEECGILRDYHFAGANRPVQVHINTEILVVLDMKTSKFLSAENQRVTSAKKKELPDDNVNTRTIINEYQRKENASDSLDKEFPPVTPFDLSFYKNTTSKMQNSELPPPPAGVKILETLPQLTDDQQQSQLTAPAATAKSSYTAGNSAKSTVPDPLTLSGKLAALILHPQELAERLAAHEFDNYTPIDIRLLEKEAFTGTLNREEFREIVLQDFIKNSAKLWRNSKPYTGSWKNFINLYYENKFVGHNGLAFNKYTLIDDISEMRWRLEYARKYFIRNSELSILFPSYYFDFTRTTAKEVGFEYTKKAWQKHQKYQKDSELRKKKIEAIANRRKGSLNLVKKSETEIKRFLNNRITLSQLFDYVEKNLPAEFLAALPDNIEKMRLTINKSTFQ
ncbi:MAG TPA: hypothetical protein VF581_07850 [Flavobacterium sp.]|jgi:hypothetical protein